MSTINFSEEVDNTSERAPRKTIASGYIGVVDIDEAEIKANKNNNEYIAVKFTNSDGQYLKQQFYLTPKSLPRLKELVVNAGLEIIPNEETQNLVVRLIGKKIGVKVDGESEYVAIEGKQIKVTRGVLGFKKFSYLATEAAPYSTADIMVNDKTGGLPPPVSLPISNDTDDLPF